MTTTERIEEAARKRYTHRYRIEGFIEGAEFGMKLMREKLQCKQDKDWPECFDVILGESGDIGSTRLVRKSDFDAMMEGSEEWEYETKKLRDELKLKDEQLIVMRDALQIIHDKSYEDKFYDGPEFRNLIASIFRTANSALDKVKEMNE